MCSMLPVCMLIGTCRLCKIMRFKIIALAPIAWNEDFYVSSGIGEDLNDI